MMQTLLHAFHPYFGACPTNGGLIPSLYDNIPCSGGVINFDSLSDIWTIVANVTRILLALSGALALIFIVLGGLLFVFSTGNSGRIDRGKNTVKYAVAGFIITIAAYGVVTFIAGRF